MDEWISFELNDNKGNCVGSERTDVDIYVILWVLCYWTGLIGRAGCADSKGEAFTKFVYLLLTY